MINVFHFVKHNDEYLIGVMCFILSAVFFFALHTVTTAMSLLAMGAIVIIWDIVDGEEN